MQPILISNRNMTGYIVEKFCPDVLNVTLHAKHKLKRFIDF